MKNVTTEIKWITMAATQTAKFSKISFAIRKIPVTAFYNGTSQDFGTTMQGELTDKTEPCSHFQFRHAILHLSVSNGQNISH